MSKTNLYQKISKIVSEVDKVEKTGYNDFQKYAYITEADLLEAVRKSIVKHGILIFSSIDECEISEVKTAKDTQLVTTIKMRHTFVDVDTGESHSVFTYGQGADKLDKGVYKAITGANKYFLLKNFLMSAGDDPEADSKASKAAKVSGFVNTSKPAKADRTAPTAPKKVSFGGVKSTKPEDVEF